MRTTLNINDRLYRRLKEEALASGRTVTDLLEEAIRRLVDQPKTPIETEPVKLTTVAGRGVRPGVDLDDTAALVELMESEDRAIT